ncbi:MAG: fumarylacetoacetate hydrolase family protein [Myxococcales bacterium]|nr:fumarylacetoacetate hydrolase family protein [Myxococcales bacterium]
MKLATFTHSGSTRIGVVEGDEVVDLAAAAPELPREMTALFAAGPAALDRAARAAAAMRTRISVDDVHLKAPVLRPPKILAVGLNYADHVAESGREAPGHPTIFNKQSTSVTGPYDPVHLPRASQALDYEGELGFVIGKRCRHVPRGRAAEVVAGYVVVNDVSVRDWQFHTPTMTMGKSFDTHCPAGPWIVTADEVGDPHSLGLRTWVDGELRQESNTKELIFDCFAIIEYLTTAFTLEPGDLISTGTPGGVGIAMKPPRLLVAGNVVRVEVEGIGQIENPVIAEPDETVRV